MSFINQNPKVDLYFRDLNFNLNYLSVPQYVLKYRLILMVKLMCAFTSDDSLSTNQYSAVSLAPSFRYRTTVLGTPTEGSQKRGTIGFTIVEPFTASDNGKLKELQYGCTKPNHTDRCKRVISTLELMPSVSRIDFNLMQIWGNRDTT